MLKVQYGYNIYCTDSKPCFQVSNSCLGMLYHLHADEINPNVLEKEGYK